MIRFLRQLLSRLRGEQHRRKPVGDAKMKISDEMAEAMASRMKLDAERHRKRHRDD